MSEGIYEVCAGARHAAVLGYTHRLTGSVAIGGIGRSFIRSRGRSVIEPDIQLFDQPGETLRSSFNISQSVFYASNRSLQTGR
jgi:hypothetical protein